MHLDTMFITHDGSVATLHLNRPARLNAFGNHSMSELNIAADTLACDDATRIVIITGEGRAFSTGIDLKELAAGEMDISCHPGWESALRTFETMDKIVIAAINGYCLGGGLQLALACDIRFAAQSAQLGLPAVKEGLIPGMGVWRLPRFVGLGRAKQLILSGQLLDARAAQAIGIIDDVVADSELKSCVQSAAERYLQSPWTAVLLSKRMTNLAFDLPFEEFLPEYIAAQAQAIQSKDHAAALQAYRDSQSLHKE
jgi:enoyl-CoA hydratase/carnithine racemase